MWHWCWMDPLFPSSTRSKAASFRYLAERFPLRAEVHRVATDVDFLFGMHSGFTHSVGISLVVGLVLAQASIG